MVGMKTRRFILIAVLVIGILLAAWQLANTYYPRQVRGAGSLLRVIEDEICTDGEPRRVVVIMTPKKETIAMEVSSEDWHGLNGPRGGVYYVEDVEWITGRHIRWHVEPIIVTVNSYQPQW